MPASTTDLRSQLLSLGADLLYAIEGRGPAGPFVVTVEYNGTVIRLTGDKPVQRLTTDDRDVLAALAAADEPLMCRGIARALKLDEDSSVLRERLSPRGALRAGGFMAHSREEGYSLTERGREVLEVEAED